MVEGYVVLQYTMEYCIKLVFYVGMRLDLDYNDNLYCFDMLCIVIHDSTEGVWHNSAGSSSDSRVI